MANYRIPVLETFSWQPPIKEITNTPPGSPTKGDRYICGSSPTGAWSGHAWAIATYTGATWMFDVPLEGWVAWDLYTHGTRRFDGSVWAYLPPSAHASTHQSGGADAIALDTLAAPTDITTLNATTGLHGLLPKLGGGTTNFLRADGTWAAPTAPTHNLLSSTHPDTVVASPVLGDIMYGNATPAWTKLAGNIAAIKKFLVQTGNGSISAAPVWDTLIAADLPAHASTHKSGGSDTIKLDELAAPTDVTTLNATTGLHGLLPKLGGGTTNFLRADGTWAAPPGASVPTGTGFRHITSGTEDAAAKLVANADVDNAAAIVESKLNLNYATHANTNDPTTDQKAALAGTSGTPSASNKYVTNQDARIPAYDSGYGCLILTV